MNRILLADDDKELSAMLKQYLGVEGFEVATAHNGSDALAMAGSGDYELLVLDVMMPELSGFDVLRELRRDSEMPVLMLTARGDDVDSIVGLELGADDYLPKPCNPRVLVARIRAILRRAQHQESLSDLSPIAETLSLDDLEIQFGSRKVLLDGRQVSMTSTEFGMLEALLRQAGHVVSKEDLSEQALGRKLSRYDRAVDMHVSNLRKKLGPCHDGGERIKTVRGVGYQYITSQETD